MELRGKIYLISNLINGKCYVGQTVQDINCRLRRHRIGPFAVGNALRKYGEENFSVEVIADSLNADELNDAEDLI